MLLRMLVSQFIRQTAERKIYEEVVKAKKQMETQRDADDEQRDSAPQQPTTFDIAFVFALGIESGGFVDLVKDVVTTRGATFLEHAGTIDGQPVVLAETGVGSESAAQGTEDLIAICRPKWIVSAGFAGGLNESLGRGHILMADQIVDLQGNQLEVGLKIAPEVVSATKGLSVGRLLTVDRIISNPKEKRELGEQHNAMACDMESMAVADVCRREGVRFLSVRVISDTVDDDLPPELGALMDQKSWAGKLGAAAGAMFRRPSVAKDMWKLQADAMKASNRLAKFLVGVVPQLDS